MYEHKQSDKSQMEEKSKFEVIVIYGIDNEGH